MTTSRHPQSALPLSPLAKAEIRARGEAMADVEHWRVRAEKAES
jgi:hypothetical protein